MNNKTDSIESDKNNGLILNEYVLLKQGNYLKKIALQEIDYITSKGNYSIIHVNETRFALNLSLIKVSEKLPDIDFIRVHKQYVVNLHKIESIILIDSQMLIKGKLIPIGRTYKDLLIQRFNIIN